MSSHESADPARARTRSARPGSIPSSNDLAREGWASRLARLVTTILFVECITGLWIYLAPFSLAAQLQVILHAGAGLLLIVPLVWFQVRHIARWWRQKPTATLVLGYLLLLAVVACVASGCVVTWESAVGPRLSSFWDLTHLVSGLAVCALAPVHIVLAWVRRRSAARGHPELGLAARRFAVRVALGIGGAAAVVAVVAIAWPVSPTELPIPVGYSMSERFEEYEEYRGNPFAPTFARTASARLVDPSVLSGSRSCGTAGCHEQILAEWLPSARGSCTTRPTPAGAKPAT